MSEDLSVVLFYRESRLGVWTALLRPFIPLHTLPIRANMKLSSQLAGRFVGYLDPPKRHSTDVETCASPIDNQSISRSCTCTLRIIELDLSGATRVA